VAGTIVSGGAITSGGDLNFTAANPTISASSYFVAPGGAYFNGSTVYTEAALQARGGIHNDNSTTLSIAGGTTGLTSFGGPISCMSGYCPANNMIRLTPNLHLNASAGSAVIVNWDNGTTGAAQTFRIGNGAAADAFYVLANGNAWSAGQLGIGGTPTAAYRVYAYDGSGTSGNNTGYFYQYGNTVGANSALYAFNYGDGPLPTVGAYLGYNLNNVAWAGYFNGNVNVTGQIFAGVKDFEIDHPLDPANKTLHHSVIESPERKNLYDGIVVLDAKGEAVVALPSYFEALNETFRYQLTAVGSAAPGLFVKTKISGNSFSIGGGAPGQEVSWQVTGVRHDAYAKTHPLIVESDKGSAPYGHVKGKYIHPEAFGLDYEDSGEHGEREREIRFKNGNGDRKKPHDPSR
jgi:hypothetical protein